MAKTYKVVADTLNIREGPGSDYEIVGEIREGEIVTAPDTSGWLPILVKDVDDTDETSKGVRWVSAKYLQEYAAPPIEPNKPEPEPAPPIGEVTGRDIVAKAETQNGKPYIFGYEVKLDDPDPKAFDCSEFVQWVCHQLGVRPEMVDGAANQMEHCHQYGFLISISEAIKTPGTLLFRIGNNGNHVVISRGDGTTIEAMGSKYGVRNGKIEDREWTHAAYIPGVSYG